MPAGPSRGHCLLREKSLPGKQNRVSPWQDTGSSPKWGCLRWGLAVTAQDSLFTGQAGGRRLTGPQVQPVTSPRPQCWEWEWAPSLRAATAGAQTAFTCVCVCGGPAQPQEWLWREPCVWAGPSGLQALEALEVCACEVTPSAFWGHNCCCPSAWKPCRLSLRRLSPRF